jgi:hypothetical protein
MFAHSVKNPDIKHYFLYTGNGYNPNGKRYRRLAYLCQQASDTTLSKRTRDVSEVTCENCLRKLRKQGLL